MYNDIDSVRRRLKNKKFRNVVAVNNLKENISTDESIQWGKSLLSRSMISLIIVLAFLVFNKTGAGFIDDSYDLIYNNTLSFVAFNNYFSDTFGSILPFDNYLNTPEDTTNVSGGSVFTDVSEYLDGYSFALPENSIVAAFDQGLVTYIGKDDNFETVVIVHQGNDIVVKYANLKNIKVEMYNYISKNDIIGELDGDSLYASFLYGDSYIKYDEYLSLSK